ncbi:MAG: response regulator [Opitutaceae bacterium]|nr:response regulator [Opitutaceae bacterium]
MTAPTSNPPQTRPAVLLVDDERPLLDALRLGLEPDFEIETAGSAEEAEVMMASRPYDAVVCDHLMPGEAGLDFLTRMQRLFPRTRRILLTGYMNPELISRSVALAGLSDCLLKPVKAAQLAESVRTALVRNSRF